MVGIIVMVDFLQNARWGGGRGGREAAFLKLAFHIPKEGYKCLRGTGPLDPGLMWNFQS